MSIYGTWLTIEDERQWVAKLAAEGIHGGVLRDGDPTPDDLDGPIIYQGSHVLPDDGDPRGGAVSFAAIPSHITRDGRGDRSEDEGPWHWIRLDVEADATTYHGGGDATVVLTRRQVERLAAGLVEWLEETAEPP